MPTYEYACANGHEFERFQRISDKPVGKCPECGAKATRKISGGQGLIFKGSGFYITDYGKDGKGPRKGGEGSGGSSGGESAAASGGDAKAAAKGDGAKAESAKPSSGGKVDAA